MADLTLQNLVATRVAEAPPTVERAADLVLAAFQGPDALRATLEGHGAASVPTRQPDQTPTATYLAALEVEGFRGIGPPATLTLEPSPGLTLVVGRNGSGKSSFAEALEMLLTGSNRRWTERAKVWQDGWRNLHHGPPRITGRFRPDGGRTTMTISATGRTKPTSRPPPSPSTASGATWRRTAGAVPWRAGHPFSLTTSWDGSWRGAPPSCTTPWRRSSVSGRSRRPRPCSARRGSTPSARSEIRRRRPRSSWRSSPAWTTSAPAASPRHSARNRGTSRRWNAHSRPTRSRSRSGAP